MATDVEREQEAIDHELPVDEGGSPDDELETDDGGYVRLTLPGILGE